MHMSPPIAGEVHVRGAAGRALLVLRLTVLMLGPAAIVGGLEIQLEYAEATLMTRAHHRQQQHGAASRRHLQRLGPNGAPPPRTLELGRSNAGVYYVTLQIGTPPRPFRLNLDTGSSSLFVPAVYSSCDTCDPHFDRGYDEAGSSTADVLLCSDARCGPCPGGCGFTDAEVYGEAHTYLGGQNECRVQPRLDAGCTECHDTCEYADDGECDDGTLGEIQSCPVGSDSIDCGLSGGGTCCPTSCCWHKQDVCAFQMTYGDGSGVSGKIVRDQVAFSGTAESRLHALAYFGIFDRMQNTDSGDPFEEVSIDGIFGIAGDAINDGRTPVLDTVLAEAGMENIFALCLEGRKGQKSAWDIGALDSTKYVGEMQYVPFVHGEDGPDGADFSFYSIAAPFRTQVGERTLSSVSQVDYDPDQIFWTEKQKEGRVVVDSGTNGILVPTSVHDALMDAIVAGVSSSTDTDYVLGFQDPGYFFAPADYNPNEDFPILRFWVRDTNARAFALDLAPQQYLRFVATGEAAHPNAWANTIQDGGTDRSIFGAPFLEAFYTSFDRDNYVLGFAPASHRCGNHLQGSSKWPITGCMDETFVEYDSAVSAEDPDACVTRIIAGCLSPLYAEYNPSATTDTTPTSCCDCLAGQSCPLPDPHCPAGSGRCGTDTCRWVGDGECDDRNGACAPYTDCIDCDNCCTEGGASAGSGCSSDTCQWRGDGECDDGSTGGAQYCTLGTDCSDCGNCCPASNAGGCGTDSCRYSGDGECDDGSRGGAQYCTANTDCDDCGNCCNAGHASGYGEGYGEGYGKDCGTNTCRYAGDHECDDGSQGGAQYCPMHTDCDDCGNCCGNSASASSCDLQNFLNACTDNEDPRCDGPCVQAMSPCIDNVELTSVRPQMQSILDGCANGGH